MTRDGGVGAPMQTAYVMEIGGGWDSASEEGVVGAWLGGGRRRWGRGWESCEGGVGAKEWRAALGSRAAGGVGVGRAAREASGSPIPPNTEG